MMMTTVLRPGVGCGLLVPGGVKGDFDVGEVLSAIWFGIIISRGSSLDTCGNLT